MVPEMLPIDGIEWEGLVPIVGRANRALPHFNGVLSAVPNPDLMLSPMSTQEAVLSSRIEGTQATLGDVLKFETGEAPAKESKEHDIYEILNYRRALRVAGRDLAKRPFSLNRLKQLHGILLDSVRGKARLPPCP